jgi:hypothetical protein
MRLTIEENREAMKRYRHIKPAPQKGPARCTAVCPGTVRTCTLRRGHGGPHISHGLFGRVLAVWDKGIKIPEDRGPVSRPALPRKQGGSGRGGFLGSLRNLKKGIRVREHYIEAGLFLAFALAMVGFVVDWVLRFLSMQ